MAEAEGLVNAVDELLDSPGGEILVSFQLYLRKRVKMLAVVFALGFMATFPLTKNFIAWLIDPTRILLSSLQSSLFYCKSDLQHT